MIDPLDGTKVFIKGEEEFTVNIALIKDEQPILGIVQHPPSKSVYYASQNHGAYKIINNETHKIYCRTFDENNYCLCTSKSSQIEFLSYLKQKDPNCNHIKMSSSLKLCLLADGKVDFYPREKESNEWDIAAAHCIVEEAGGSVLVSTKERLRYSKDKLLNPSFIAIADYRNKSDLSKKIIRENFHRV